MTTETPSPEERQPVFGRGAWLFFGAVGVVFATLAVAIPMVIIASSTESTGSAGPVVTEAPGLAGEQLAADTGCLACHSTDGTDLVGPTWLGLPGSERPLESGETVVADDPYLLNSIIDPKAQIVAGFNPTMPEDYQDRLTAEELDDLVEYLNSLG